MKSIICGHFIYVMVLNYFLVAVSLW